MLRGFIHSKKVELNASSHSINAQSELQDVQDAMQAAEYIMNDDLDGAENGLGSGASSFHKLGKGMVAFLRAALGFEPEVMREASDQLADAEKSASVDHRRAQRDTSTYRSNVYPAGAEFALCRAECQLMSAVVGVLNESLTESIKGFYKLRKAYLTLDGILAAETRYGQNVAGNGLNTAKSTSTESLRSQKSAYTTNRLQGNTASDDASQPDSISSSARSIQESGPANNVAQAKTVYDIDHHSENGDTDEETFYDAEEVYDKSEKPENFAGHLDFVEADNKVPALSSDDQLANGQHLPSPKPPPSEVEILDDDPDSEVFANPIDVFIHSGANLCFGLLLVMLSMIPPAFAKLLSIIGFRGDRNRGLRLLWQASKFHNINGAMAGLCLLGYYHAIVGFSDIVPDCTMTVDGEEPVEGYPKERCTKLLAEMRSRHPKSRLWLLEEAREESANRHLAKALSLLSHTKPSPLKQVEAIDMFEKAVTAMFLHDYELCSESFISCVSLNNWSHALYYYIAGAAQVELYRSNKLSNPAAAADHAKKATEYLKKAPDHAGKKKFMARQLPFDVFVTRKIKKWESRAHEFDTTFIDAVGVSPLEEMTYFWNGFKRMDTTQLNDSLEILAWNDSQTSNPQWTREGPDERAILALLRAVVLRNSHRWDEARRTLESEVLDVDKAELKGGLKDDYTAPAAHYEMGVINWMQRIEVAEKGQRNGVNSRDEEERFVRECEKFVERTAKWESYELDARFGLKIATAQDTLAKWRKSRERSG